MTHKERKAKHEWSCEGISEMAERIACLEELAIDLWLDLARVMAFPRYADAHRDELEAYDDRMREMVDGLPTEDEQ